MFIITQEDEHKLERDIALDGSAHKSRVFAADLPELRHFTRLFFTEKNEEEGEIEEFVPESEADVRQMLAEVKRLGITPA